MEHEAEEGADEEEIAGMAAISGHKKTPQEPQGFFTPAKTNYVPGWLSTTLVNAPIMLV